MEEVRKLLFGGHNPYENVARVPFNNHGWASESPVYGEYIEKIKPKLIVEVGTWLGGSARALAAECITKGIEDFEIVCIDTFLGSFEMWLKQTYLMSFDKGRPTIYDIFLSNTLFSNMEKYLTPFPVDSQNGFLTLEKLKVVPDLVYIDAGHDYFSVKNDLENWSGILRPGGVLIGDDWRHPPIKQAAIEVFGESNIVDHDNKFSWVKPEGAIA